MRHLLFGLAGCAILAAPAWAAPRGNSPTAAADAVAATMKAAAQDDTIDPNQSITDQMKDYVEKSGLGARERRHDLFVLTGTATVPVMPENNDWVRLRSLAFDNALLNAEAEFVKREYTQSSSKVIRNLYQASDQTPPPYDTGEQPGQVNDLLRKLVGVASGKLDGELRKMGIDPKQYEAEKPAQRYTLMQRALSKQAMESAFDEMSGLVPVKSFEGHDSKEIYTIGVVAVVSGHMKDLAREVMTAHGELSPKPARAQDLRTLYADKKDLVREFGVRVMFDQDGMPVIVSFAQWGSAYFGSNPIVAEQYNEIATDKASMLADAQIADFLKGSARINESGNTGQDIELAAERFADGHEQQDPETVKVLDGLIKKIRTDAFVNISGIRTLYKWHLKHPVTGKPIVGVIRIWSAADEQAVRAFRDRRAPPPVAHATTGTPTRTGTPGIEQSRDLMNADDF